MIIRGTANIWGEGGGGGEDFKFTESIIDIRQLFLFNLKVL